jgi:hypothetical protein
VIPMQICRLADIAVFLKLFVQLRTLTSSREPVSWYRLEAFA